MNAKELLPNNEERKQVKQWIDILVGILTRITDENEEIIFDSRISYENYYNKEYD